MFLLSNIKLKDSKKFGNIFLNGREPNQQKNNNFLIIEGNVYQDDEINIDFNLNNNDKNITGLFNIIKYEYDKSRLIIVNDQLGRLPLYLFSSGKRFAISNCFWTIADSFGFSSLDLNRNAVKEYLYLSCLINQNGTFFNNVSVIKPGTKTTIHIHENKFELESSTYWHYRNYINSDIKYDIDNAIELIDEQFNKQFKRIAEMSHNKSIGIGNSGGVDSRLVAALISKHSENIYGNTFVIDATNDKKSGTYKAAEKIAKISGIENEFTSMSVTKYDSKVALDIRSSPFSNSQLFKNNYENLQYFDVLISGQEGAMVYPKAPQHDANANLEKAIRSKFVKNFRGLDASNFGIDYEFDVTQFVGTLSKDLQTNDPNDLFEYAFLYYLSRYVYCGGFESLSRTKETHFLYYPLIFNAIQHVDRSLLNNKFLIKEYLRLKFPSYYKVRHQKFYRLNDQKSKYYPVRYLNKKYMSFIKRHGDGMNFNRLKDKKLKEYFNNIMNDESEVLTKIFGKKYIEFTKHNFQEIPLPLITKMIKLKHMFVHFEKDDYRPYLNNKIPFV